MLSSPCSRPHPMTITIPQDVTTQSLSYSTCVHARVVAAPAFGGEKMYQVKLSCQGKNSSIYKSKEDFRNVMNILRFVGAMARSRAAQGQEAPCQVCRECSVMAKVRCVNEANLNEYLDRLLTKLRSFSKQSIDTCSTHRGVIHVLKEFLSVRNGKYFSSESEYSANNQRQSIDSLHSEGDAPEQPHEQDLDDCEAFHQRRDSMHRTLSQRFATFDSVC